MKNINEQIYNNILRDSIGNIEIHISHTLYSYIFHQVDKPVWLHVYNEIRYNIDDKLLQVNHEKH